MKKKTRNLIECKDDSKKNGTTLKEEIDKENKKNKENYHCVQCGEEMKCYIDVQDKKVLVCNNPECANYGLLQLGEEIMNNIKVEL